MNYDSTTHANADNELLDVSLHDTITAISPGNSPDNEDQFYPIDKLDAHVRNVPHVAISLFIFKDGELLIQRRASTKYHSAGLWANTTCSHPRWNESPEHCAARRLQEELGFKCDVEKFGEISYRAKVGDLFENEQVHCFVGYLDSAISKEELHEKFNSVEVSGIDFLSLTEIQERVARQPGIFTEWFKIYMTMYADMLESVQSSFAKSQVSACS